MKFLSIFLDPYQTSKRRRLSIAFGHSVESNRSRESSVDELKDSVHSYLETGELVPLETIIPQDRVVQCQLQKASLLGNRPVSGQPAESYLSDKANEIFSKLVDTDEADVQMELFQFIQGNDLSLIDCSRSARNCPFLKLRNGDDLFRFSGEPDLASTEFPFFLEIKDTPSKASTGSLSPKEYEVLQQVWERIEGVSILNETIQNISGVATCGRRAWFLQFTRKNMKSYENDGFILQDQLRIYRIAIAEIFPLVSRITALSMCDPLYYMNEHMLPLSRTIQKLGFHPGFVRIQLYKNANSAIYAICPYDIPNAALILPDTTGVEKCFMIKINTDATKGAHEIRVLKKLKDCLSDKRPLGYIIGVLSSFDQFSWFDDKYLKEKYSRSFVDRRTRYGSADDLFYTETEMDPLNDDNEKKEKTHGGNAGIGIVTGPVSTPPNEGAVRTMNKANKFMVQMSFSCMKSYSRKNYFRCWWNYGHSCEGSESSIVGGKYEAIVMKPGCTPAMNNVEKYKVQELLKKDLELIWEVGIAHTDLRRFNILLIYEINREVYQIIDYDHSVDFGTQETCAKKKLEELKLSIEQLSAGDRRCALFEVIGSPAEGQSCCEWNITMEIRMMCLATEWFVNTTAVPSKSSSLSTEQALISAHPVNRC
jgi:hypothetical protein